MEVESFARYHLPPQQCIVLNYRYLAVERYLTSGHLQPASRFFFFGFFFFTVRWLSAIAGQFSPFSPFPPFPPFLRQILETFSRCRYANGHSKPAKILNRTSPKCWNSVAIHLIKPIILNIRPASGSLQLIDFLQWVRFYSFNGGICPWRFNTFLFHHHHHHQPFHWSFVSIVTRLASWSVLVVNRVWPADSQGQQLQRPIQHHFNIFLLYLYLTGGGRGRGRQLIPRNWKTTNNQTEKRGKSSFLHSEENVSIW